jgi:aminoglycoside phosphotransferase (APT) family kinase protein
LINIDKININISLVQQLISTQFPQWAHLDIKRVEPGGWDNRTFHLGDTMSVRLPSSDEYAPQVKKEHQWLPILAPQLPLPIPVPLTLGKPTKEYPFHWSVYQWITGETASIDCVNDLNNFASSLANFLIALQKINSTNGPISLSRGCPLTTYDAETRQAIIILNNQFDTDTITALWNTAMASTWEKSPVWVHGDISPNNLLVKNGKLSAVIDFGSMCIGDPACDLAIAWTLLTKESRAIFRTTLEVDNATWERGRGWALWKALIICAQLPGTNHLEIEKSIKTIDEIIADYHLF